MPLVFVMAFVALWLAAGQDPSAIVPYFRTSLELTSGYGDAMALWTYPTSQMVPFFVAGACLLWVRTWSTRSTATLHTLAFAWLLFQVFKASFVRHDEHAALALAVLPVLVLLCAPFLWRLAHAWPARVLLVGLVVASLWPQIAGWRLFFGQTYFDLVMRSVQRAPGNIAMAAGLLRGSSAAKGLDVRYAAAAHVARTRLAFPTPKGSVDLYPSEQGYVVAHGWRWGGRPVFQSYVAYTAALAELNARHLRGADAPDTVFFAVQPIDRRYPALDDGLSWPELLARYDVRGSAGPYVWLERAERPRSYEFATAGTVVARFGEEVAVPSGDLIWARVDLRPTILGRVVRVLHKVPQPTLAVNGVAQFRLIPALARAGFLVSPLVATGRAFAALASGRGGESARSIRIEVDDPGRFFAPEMRIEFSRLSYAP
jgi:hypothetical protein